MDVVGTEEVEMAEVAVGVVIEDNKAEVKWGWKFGRSWWMWIVEMVGKKVNATYCASGS